MSGKKVSVIVPCYNAEQYIDRLMDSLVRQTLGTDRMEIILVNDASTDGTWDKLLEWEQRYPETCMVVNLTTNIKQGGARNAGVAYATGTYLAFADADDWVEPDMYEKMTAKAEELDAEIVFCNYDRPDDAGNVEPVTEWGSAETFYNLMTLEERRRFVAEHHMLMMVWMAVYRRQWFVYNEIVFPEKLFYEDLVMLLVLLLGKRMYSMPQCFYHYYRNPGSTTGSNRNPLDRFKVLMEIYPRLTQPEFEGFRDIWEYWFYEQGFFMAACTQTVFMENVSLMRRMKALLLSYVPDIRRNPYYTREARMPVRSAEYLLHPLMEEEITQESATLLSRRVLYCLRNPLVRAYMDALAELKADLLRGKEAELDQLMGKLDAVCELYGEEGFAHREQAQAFLTDVHNYRREENICGKTAARIDQFIVAITQPEPDSGK